MMFKTISAKLNERTLQWIVYGWVIGWLIAFIISIASMFPGNKVGEQGYYLYLSLACAAFSFVLLLLPFLCIYNIVFYQDFKDCKRTTRQKKSRKKVRIRRLQTVIVYGLAIFLSLLALAFLIIALEKWYTLLYALACLLVVYFGIKTYRHYCKLHPIKKDESNGWIIMLINALWIIPLVIGMINAKNFILDQPYLHTPKQVVLQKAKIYRNNSFRTKFYYHLDGQDENGKEYSFRIDNDKAHRYYQNKPNEIVVEYLPNTNVVMDFN